MSDIEQRVREKFPEDVVDVSDFRGDLAIKIKRERVADVCGFLLSQEGGAFAMMLDLCGVDYLGREPRFEVVYHLMSLETKKRVRIKTPVSESELTVPTVTHLWKAANWFEREAYDMFGITFSGHPDLRRILTHDEFVGHALRKDYPLDKRQELSRPTPFAEE